MVTYWIDVSTLQDCLALIRVQSAGGACGEKGKLCTKKSSSLVIFVAVSACIFFLR